MRKPLRKPLHKPLRTRVADLMHSAWIGATGRVSRTILASLGIALGVAAYVALSGIAASNQATLLARLDALGANLQVVTPGQDAARQTIPLPDYAPETIARQPNVEQVGVFTTPPEKIQIFKNQLVPTSNGNALALNIMAPGALDAIGATYAHGHGIDRNNEHLPVAVLGSEAAWRLGVTDVGDRVLIDNEWYGVIGILDPLPQAETLNTSAIIGKAWALAHYPDQAADIAKINAIYVRTVAGDAETLRRMIAHAANLAGGNVSVTASADLSKARNATSDSLTTLGLMIGVIALAVGGMSIANMMIVTVMERRGEIGLRRALGATPGNIRMQFVAEAAMLSALGGLAGILIGAGTAGGVALTAGQPLALDWGGLPLAWGAAVTVGIMAGLYPAGRAARLTPTEALRSE
ncbi:MacB-like periplasmic core domain-containing protein [Bifidobacterium ramosum]|uniref:FtsX-like permease family protein n=1 Tax=Bifidobacterium ramosum TaxID=1798158 RepID=A0A6L4X3V7_9BIFI|nr:ABC transporter permease [Bifidobacterium ramosum]KAB8289438.1 MacB-like periplasmic core domain-containing protein [Bifidobacterium ramosum]NEG71134.1 FtsX-like permease family protein [Bifidobacterium ramosum]